MELHEFVLLLQRHDFVFVEPVRPVLSQSSGWIKRTWFGSF